MCALCMYINIYVCMCKYTKRDYFYNLKFLNWTMFNMYKYRHKYRHLKEFKLEKRNNFAYTLSKCFLSNKIYLLMKGR